jgi:flagellum-specific peptidoglycan hydrolase FlgJ
VEFKNTSAMISNSNTFRTNQLITIQGGHFDLDLNQIKVFISKNWLNLLIIALFLYVVFTKNLHFSIKLNEDGPIAKAAASMSNFAKPVSEKKQAVLNLKQAPEGRLHDVRFNELADLGDTPAKAGNPVVELLPSRNVKSVASMRDNNVANNFNNIEVLWSPQRFTPSVVKSKKDKCWEYVSRFANIAKMEREKFGIPVSITLAQGLLESNAGESKLTQKANNHFGIKTFSKRVNHVVMRDDTPNDKFKMYNSAWESYRDHSLLLMRDHYKHLQYLSKTDYVGWARGLQKAGYATDKQYADKLIQLIENLKLFRFDEV